MPGLDGLRAIAVLGVISYHLGLGAVPGGLLGVSVFFTLSGYLITDLLLDQHAAGRLSLTSFWVARARRLLPALGLMLTIVTAWVTIVGPHQTTAFRTAVGSAALYVNNWWLVLRDVSYFAQFEAPGPLNHLWSLSVEEQFYIVWPILVLLGCRVLRGPARRLRPRLGAAILALALMSSAVMALLYRATGDPSRVYYGTDTRAAELLVGAALAAVWPSRSLQRRVTAAARTTIDAVGSVGLVVIAVMFLRAEALSPFLYRGGFLLLSLSVGLVVASVVHPASRLGPVVGCRPMRWIGARSYGLYLWHVPIIILTTPSGATGPSLARGTLQAAATVAVAGLSWRFVEDPIRHGALGRVWARRSSWSRRPWQGVTPLGGAVLAGGTCVLAAALAGLAGVAVDRDTVLTDAEITITKTVTAPGGGTPEVTSAAGGLGPCTEVVHIGGSTSLGLVSDSFIPNESDQIPAQYTRVGVTTQHYEIAGGRAIVEPYRDNPAARTSAQAWRDRGYHGCWVLALGTMDAATVAKGEAVGMVERIDAMMEIADGDPVLWVNARTVATTGLWRAEVMPPWNEALLAACERYPNMRIYDWASDVQDDWFGSDGIHNNTVGYIARARNIADALAKAFPGADARSDCLISL